MKRIFLKGDIVVLRGDYQPYMAIDPMTKRYQVIQADDVCMWLGRDPELVGSRTLPRVLLGDKVVEVMSESIFEAISETR